MNLNEKLKQGEATVKFTKKNGDVRTMRCTKNFSLVEKVYPEFVPPKSENSKTKPGLFVVWDLDKNAWRAFNEDSIINE